MEMAWKRKQCRRKAFTVRWYLGMGGESERIGKDQKDKREREAGGGRSGGRADQSGRGTVNDISRN
jgi:hypothetical protein